MLHRLKTTRVAGEGETHCGGREDNEDVLIVEPELGLYGVLDGMGGHAAGEVAAQLAKDTLVDFVRRHSACADLTPRVLLRSAIEQAAALVHEAGKEPQCKGMGTTVVACLVADAHLVVIGHVGDSRAYLLPEGGGLRLLTSDHTIVQELINGGSLTPDDAKRSSQKHVLTRNLGRDEHVLVDVREWPVLAGERLLLCSDGLHDYVPLDELQRVLASRVIPRVAARALIELALKNGTHDNVSALVLDIDGST